MFHQSPFLVTNVGIHVLSERPVPLKFASITYTSRLFVRLFSTLRQEKYAATQSSSIDKTVKKRICHRYQVVIQEQMYICTAISLHMGRERDAGFGSKNCTQHNRAQHPTYSPMIKGNPCLTIACFALARILRSRDIAPKDQPPNRDIKKHQPCFSDPGSF